MEVSGQLMHWPLYPRERAPDTHCTTGWIGPQDRSGRGGEEKNLLLKISVSWINDFFKYKYFKTYKVTLFTVMVYREFQKNPVHISKHTALEFPYFKAITITLFVTFHK
jgi:hypothetical protein